MARYAELNRSLVEIVTVMGCAGFGFAIGVHFVVEYLDFFHLLPAFIGLFIFILAAGFLWAGWRQSTNVNPPEEIGVRSRTLK
jgi:TRAP-type C4-dicarboxylate transport system permease small subunit